MKARVNYYMVAPNAFEPMRAIDAYLRKCDLERRLVELVKMRASQINGCAYCLHAHSASAMVAGELPRRLILLDAWRESKLYTERERAALAWTEALTKVAETRAPDADYEPLEACFSEKEIAELTLLIGTINSWNRIAIGLRSHHPNDVGQEEAKAE